jgi:hypothetical protein
MDDVTEVRRVVLPRVFVGSTRKQLAFVTALKEQLKDFADVTLWCDEGVLQQPHPVTDDLAAWAARVDYAVMVFAHSDAIPDHQNQAWQARDYVALGLGFFLGRLGRERVLYVAPKGEDSQRPADVLMIPVIECETDGRQLSVGAAPEVAVKVRSAIAASWHPISAELSDRLDLATSRQFEALRWVLQRLCDAAGFPAPNPPDILAAGHQLSELLAQLRIPFPTGLPAGGGPGRVRAIMAGRLHDPECETDLGPMLGLIETQTLNLRAWAGDEDAWQRMRLYVERRRRYDAILARTRRAAVEAAKLLVAATGATSPVPITEASAESVLSRLSLDTGIEIRSPQAYAKPHYAWPSDNHATDQEEWLTTEERELAQFESFIRSARTQDILARSHAVLTRYLRVLVSRTNELGLLDGIVDPSRATLKDIRRIRSVYESSHARAEDIAEGRPLSRMRDRLQAELRAPSGDEVWLDRLAGMLDSMETELDRFDGSFSLSRESGPDAGCSVEWGPARILEVGDRGLQIRGSLARPKRPPTEDS